MSETKQRTAVHTRWLIRADMPRILQIDAAGFGPDAWDEEAWLAALRKRERIGMAAEVAGRVVGFMLYELREHSLGLLRVAVHPRYRRLGVGESMLAKLAEKLSSHRRTRIVADVPERDLACQLWLRACGFRCTAIVGHAYRFKLAIPTEQDTQGAAG